MTDAESKVWRYDDAKLWLLAIQEVCRDGDFEDDAETYAFLGAWWDALFDYLSQGACFDL